MGNVGRLRYCKMYYLCFYFRLGSKFVYHINFSMVTILEICLLCLYRVNRRGKLFVCLYDTPHTNIICYAIKRKARYKKIV